MNECWGKQWPMSFGVYVQKFSLSEKNKDLSFFFLPVCTAHHHHHHHCYMTPRFLVVVVIDDDDANHAGIAILFLSPRRGGPNVSDGCLPFLSPFLAPPPDFVPHQLLGRPQGLGCSFQDVIVFDPFQGWFFGPPLPLLSRGLAPLLFFPVLLPQLSIFGTSNLHRALYHGCFAAREQFPHQTHHGFLFLGSGSAARHTKVIHDDLRRHADASTAPFGSQSRLHAHVPGVVSHLSFHGHQIGVGEGRWLNTGPVLVERVHDVPCAGGPQVG